MELANIGYPPLVVDPNSSGGPTREVEVSIVETPITTPQRTQGEVEEEPWKMVTRKSKGKHVTFHLVRMVTYNQDPVRTGVMLGDLM